MITSRTSSWLAAPRVSSPPSLTRTPLADRLAPAPTHDRPLCLLPEPSRATPLPSATSPTPNAAITRRPRAKRATATRRRLRIRPNPLVTYQVQLIDPPQTLPSARAHATLAPTAGLLHRVSRARARARRAGGRARGGSATRAAASGSSRCDARALNGAR